MENTVDYTGMVRFRKLSFKKSNYELTVDEIVPMPDLGDMDKLKEFVNKNTPVLSSTNDVYIPLEDFYKYIPFYIF